MGLCVSSPNKPIPSKHSVPSALTRSAPVSDQRREVRGVLPAGRRPKPPPALPALTFLCLRSVSVILRRTTGRQERGPWPGGRRAGRYFRIYIPATLGSCAQPAPLGMATPHAEHAVSGGTHHPLLQRAARRAEKTRTSRPDCVPRPPRAHTGERGGRRRAGPWSVQRRPPRVLWRRGRRGVHSLRGPGGHTPGPASQGK